MGEKSVFFLADLLNSSAFVQLECLEFFGATDLSSHFIFNVLVCLFVLNALVLFCESQLFKRLDLALERVVGGGGECSIELAVVSLEKGALQNVLCFSLSKFSLEKHMALGPKQLQTMVSFSSC